MTSTEQGGNAGDQDMDEQLGADYYVQSPDGSIYPANAQGRSDLVARGYTDITDLGGAEKFREQNTANQSAQAGQSGQSGQSGGTASAEPVAGSQPTPSPEQATRSAPAAAGRAQRPSNTDQADDTPKA